MPSVLIAGRNRAAVPWYRYWSGCTFLSSTSTGIECPWLALIFVWSSLNEYRCLLSSRTIRSSVSMSISRPVAHTPRSSALTSAQPCSSNVIPASSGWCRRIRQRNRPNFISFSRCSIVAPPSTRLSSILPRFSSSVKNRYPAWFSNLLTYTLVLLMRFRTLQNADIPIDRRPG